VSDFCAVSIDPPWAERGAGKIKRGADRHYALLEEHQIIEAVLRCPHWQLDPHAHLYLWVTNNFLESGLFVMRALGFRYVTNITWSKMGRIGLGQYFRGKHELCLFGIRKKGRGTVHRTEDRSIPSVLEAPVAGHSAKPDSFYRRVEARSKGPYLELFAREPREGWTCWGDEL
jgi:N6-adenosine-specific RNA methylase IME4